MPIPLGSVTVSASGVVTVYAGTPGTVGAVAIYNESPYAINASAGTGALPIMAQTVDILYTDTGGFSGNITLTTSDYLSNASSAPSFVVFLAAYQPGEPIRGTYPAPLMRLANGIATVTNDPATTIEQDMWTAFVLTGVTPSYTGFNLYSTTGGIAFPRQSDGSLLRTAVGATSQNLTLPSTTYYHDLNPDGSFSLGSSHSTQANYLTIATIVTDASSNIISLTDTRVMSTTLFSSMSASGGAPGPVMYNLHVNKTIQVDSEVSVQGTVRTTSGSTGNGYLMQIASNDELEFLPTGSTSAQGVVFYGWFTGSPGQALPIFSVGSTFNQGMAWVDTTGVLHATGPVTLAAGNQETGRTGLQVTATAASQVWGAAVNFKTVMTNVPTSINTGVDSGGTSNVGTLTANNINVYGFWLTLASAASGLMYWRGIYATVGNCLLAVDATLRTLDHHCDPCGQVSRAAPFSAVYMASGSTPADAALSFTCPSCGAIEHFNTGLTSADEADPTPQGSGQYATTRGAQATLIRQLMTALGLPVNP